MYGLRLLLDRAGVQLRDWSVGYGSEAFFLVGKEAEVLGVMRPVPL